ncbi:3-keto-L-gulonate-6-phosphate decarboxylase [[Mycoplasma] cavipharyngis]|uniref:3-dehydro-L-gulonate-6-phosphate decarboxylase n=1 Tax=[Mycoplasma] cavipharyngis TaxID=92757 RepID=UPI003704883F
MEKIKFKKKTVNNKKTANTKTKKTKIGTTNQSRPLLQIALDTLTIEEAIAAVKIVEPYIDIVEVGTILLGAVGKQAISLLKSAFPNKIIVADLKVADAGSIFAKMAFDAQADLLTVICAADANTIKSAYDQSLKYDHKPEIQIELTSKFSTEDLLAWKTAGAKHVVYHRSRDAQAAGVNWTKTDLEKIEQLDQAGFKVSITGGLAAKDIKFFKNSNPAIFIAGRTIRGENAVSEAKNFVREINKYFSTK